MNELTFYSESKGRPHGNEMMMGRGHMHDTHIGQLYGSAYGVLNLKMLVATIDAQWRGWGM